MTRHMKSHTGERNYECPICLKKFLYSYNVTAHVKHVHYHEKRPTTNEEKLTCTICGKVRRFKDSTTSRAILRLLSTFRNSRRFGR
jgi:uncharacterized C2H2 Zn-finger protein